MTIEKRAQEWIGKVNSIAGSDTFFKEYELVFVTAMCGFIRDEIAKDLYKKVLYSSDNAVDIVAELEDYIDYLQNDNRTKSTTIR